MTPPETSSAGAVPALLPVLRGLPFPPLYDLPGTIIVIDFDPQIVLGTARPEDKFSSLQFVFLAKLDCIGKSLERMRLVDIGSFVTIGFEEHLRIAAS